jgi:hypothetical protein
VQPLLEELLFEELDWWILDARMQGF